MSLIKFKWTKNCVLSVAGADNANANSINIIFTIKDNKNHQNFLARNLKDHFIGMNRKQKMRIKTRQINIVIFSNQILSE